jgi:hypothetical protein
MRSFQRTILWRRLGEPGIEYFTLWRTDAGWGMAGTVLCALDSAPVQVRYRLTCDDLWNTRKVDVHMRVGKSGRTLEMIVDDDHRWWMGSKELAAVRGCRDVDLEVTPATNMLPIRRLGLAVGESRDVTAAWIRFPDLVIVPLTQIYTRLDESHYRYESGGGAFTTDVEVDDLGLARRYAGGWEREAAL